MLINSNFNQNIKKGAHIKARIAKFQLFLLLFFKLQQKLI